MTVEDGNQSRARRRLERQFKAIERLAPATRHPLRTIRARGWWIVRVPVGLLLVAGGVLSFLPVLGIWMLPLGLLLLAVDLPILRGPITAFIIRSRRRAQVWRRWWRRRRKNR